MHAECLPHQVQMPEDQMISLPLAIAPYPANASLPSRPVPGGPAVACRPEKLSAGTGRCSYSVGYLGANLGANLGAWEDSSPELLLAPPRVLRPKPSEDEAKRENRLMAAAAVRFLWNPSAPRLGKRVLTTALSFFPTGAHSFEPCGTGTGIISGAVEAPN